MTQLTFTAVARAETINGRIHLTTHIGERTVSTPITDQTAEALRDDLHIEIVRAAGRKERAR